MTMKIGFLCFGEGGSNIGEYAAQKGFPVIVVNSAKIDLDKIQIVPKDCRIHLDGWEGAGRDREIGKEATMSHLEKLFKKSKEKFEDCDIVFAVGSAAGGTGSGALPIGIEILSEIKNNVCAITILPSNNESPKAHMNALECFSELSQYEQLNSTFIIDNQKTVEVFNGNDRTKLYNLSIHQLIDNFSEVCSLTSKTSLISNFDKNDLTEILNERGFAIVSKVTIPTAELKSSSDVINVIRKSWNEICSPEIEYGQIVKAGVFGKIPKEITSIIDVKKIFEETGMPYDIIESYYENTDHPDHCIFYTLLTGLSYPMERLTRMEQEVQAIEQELFEKVENSRTQTFITTSWGNKFKRNGENLKQVTTVSKRLSQNN